MRRLERCMLRADELSVTGQLDALLAEDLGGRHLILLESGDANAFERWAYTRAAERFEGIAFLDFSGAARPGAVLATIGGVVVRTGPPNEQLRRLLLRHRVVLMSGMDDALTRLPTALTRWLAWCANHLPLAILCTADARPYLAATRLHRLPMGVDRIIDPTLAGSATRLASFAMTSWMEAI